jgi:hypothetical protein
MEKMGGFIHYRVGDFARDLECDMQNPFCDGDFGRDCAEGILHEKRDMA